MPKRDLVFDAGEYAPVAERITLFYSRFPNGRILTRLVSRTAHDVTVQAFVYRSLDDKEPSASGLACERFGDGDVNTVACLENTETSAIGRALANLGLTASYNRPSREEMEKASRERRRNVAESSAPRGLTTRSATAVSIAMQRRADRVMDALDLLGQATRAGLPPKRGQLLRTAVTDASARLATIERVERLLRTWISRRYATHLRL